ncbi:phage shock protein A (PspA) family protein [Bacillus oleivorans]|uniref:Phage shock protein A (PspA) family protein n=1 Tax=Bacillus oleivorans TaxID=1448271 RepID=A0A285CST5_9BACI|nr:PspA/IM30 family protein [Bacillus oleivorans]SNX70485.1 phage shock protein A (PspA) family protein [Bacillus oleivorans]
MTNLWDRIKNSVAADFHEILDQKEQKNPIASLNQYLRQCEQEVEKVRKLLERQYMLKDEFSREYHHAVELMEKRAHQADVATKAGDQELHQFAAAELRMYEERVARLKEARTKVLQQLVELERKYEEMKHKLKDMHIKRMELMGRENMTRAHMKINKMLDSTSYSSSQPFSKFSELENYLDRLEYRINSDYHRNTIDAKIAQLEKELKKEESSTVQ